MEVSYLVICIAAMIIHLATSPYRFVVISKKTSKYSMTVSQTAKFERNRLV